MGKSISLHQHDFKTSNADTARCLTIEAPSTSLYLCIAFISEARTQMIPRLRLVSALFVFVLLILFVVSIGLGFHRSIITFEEGKEPSSGIQDVHSEKVAPPVLTNVCPDRLDWIRSLAKSPDITFPLKYARRDIVVRPKQGLESTSISKHEEPLIPDFRQILDYNACEFGEKQRLSPLNLDIPEIPTHVNASHILFGAATTLERLNASIPFFQRWLADSGARLIIVVTGNDDATPDSDIMATLQTQMRNLGMLVTLMKPIHRGDSNVERYFSLIQVLYENRDANTKWYGFIDDDTFFTSISRLVSRLGEYDHQKKLYLGAVSEEWWTVVHYGWIAMGRLIWCLLALYGETESCRWRWDLPFLGHGGDTLRKLPRV